MDGTSDDVKDMGLKHQTVLVKKDEHIKIIGLVVVGLYGFDSERGLTVWIRELVVDQNYQGMGIGQNLLSDGLSYGKDHGAKKAFLHVDELNENAIHIYRKFGFCSTEDGQIDMIKS
jgi:ribosomal protein S18 acetylase RimI-like enzyme